MFHSPGWVGNVAGPYSTMDKAIDPKIAEGLRRAWEARAVLGLDDATVALVAAETEAVARTPFFRFPAVRLNQINWPAELYAHEAAVTGTPELLVGDYRAHVRSFLDGARAGIEPVAEPALPLPARAPAGRAREHRLGRVREHDAALPGLVRRGAGRGDGAAPARRRAAAAALGRARAVRLLDALGRD